MLILEARDIKKSYADRLLFDIPLLQIHEGDRIGLTGANGSGKTTLLHILAGELTPDEGQVRRWGELAYVRQLGGVEPGAPAEELKRFGVAEAAGRQALSGGEVTRLKLAGALGRPAALLMADEPTTDLDMQGVELLARRLDGWPTLLLISHDRALLNGLCTEIWALGEGTLARYPGNYEDYRRQREQALLRRWEEYEQYVSQRDHLRAAIADRSNRARAMRKTPKRMGNSEARLHRRAATEKQEKVHDAARALKTRLEQLEVREKPRIPESVRINFGLTNPPKGKTVVTGRDLSFAYGERILFDHARFTVENGVRTALVGPNGCGKTTLLRLISDGHPAVRVAPQARLGLLHQHHEDLLENETVLQNVLRGSVQEPSAVRTILARLLFRGDDVAKPVGVLSGGERVKAALARLVVSSANVLLLDEPTNYLDIDSLEAMEAVLTEYEGAVLFTSHDRQFIDAVAHRLIVVEGGKTLDYSGGLSAFLAARSAPPPAARGDERLVLELRRAELIARLSQGTAARELAEAEYEAVCRRIKALEDAEK